MFGTVLPGDAKKILAVLGKSNVVKDAYLAGGSALALHLGHRISIDFDFFSNVPFQAEELSENLKTIGNFKPEMAKGLSLIGTFEGIKFSYFGYNYSLVEKTTKYLGVSIADPKDIAAMKLVAITDRSTKKDYIDLYMIAKKLYPLETMLTFYDQKYKLLRANHFTLIKSLTFFQDAEETEMPHMRIPLQWEEVKRFFISESLRLGKKYLEE
jgi:hypothetical protein